MIGIHYITSNTDKYMVNNVYGLSGQALHQYLLSCLMKTAAHIKKKKKRCHQKRSSNIQLYKVKEPTEIFSRRADMTGVLMNTLWVITWTASVRETVFCQGRNRTKRTNNQGLFATRRHWLSFCLSEEFQQDSDEPSSGFLQLTTQINVSFTFYAISVASAE